MKTMHKHLSFLAIIALVAPLSAAEIEEVVSPESQGVSSTAILDWIEACEAKLDAVHGYVIRRHGKVIAEGTWAPHDTLNETHMLYSHSKAFTSTAIGILVDEGKVDLDERVVDIFTNDLPAKVSSNLSEMRVRDLLSMNVGAEKTDAAMHDQPNGDWTKAFLANEITDKPGLKFRYDSSATYMLAAIVKAKTGEDLMDFLKKRLFDPLGFSPCWTGISPTGISCGGWGMNMTTRDLSKFGQLYLDRGVWKGRRILSDEWVTLATARQTWSGAIAVANEDGSDWHQGYGFKFWRCRYGAYRADGAAGQLTVVMPKEDMVVSVHAGLGEMQLELNLIWEHLLKNCQAAPLQEDSAALEKLRTREKGLVLKTIASTANVKEVAPRTVKMDKNPFGFKTPTLTRVAEGWVLSENGLSLAIGDGKWRKCEWTFTGDRIEPLFKITSTRRVAACGGWTAENEFTLRYQVVGGIQHGDLKLN